MVFKQYLHMELLAQFVKDTFFLLLVMRIAVIVGLAVVIVKALRTPYITQLFRRFRGLTKRSTFPGEKSTLGHH